MEQIRAKRAGLGLRGCEPDRAYRGLTLFAPRHSEWHGVPHRHAGPGGAPLA